MFSNNLVALIVTLVIALIWLRLNDFIANKGWISSDLSRKIIHTGTGPIFVLCWLLFNEEPCARFFAAVIPLLITGQFFMVGSGLLKDEAAVQAMSRTGDRREILRGPLFYGVIFVILTIVYWRDSPIGVVALMQMCGGDGLADILGKRLASAKLPWSPQKTVSGTIGMFVGAWIFSTGIVAVFVTQGIFLAPLSFYLFPITIIAVAGAAVESLPFADIDNITVSAVSVILGYLLF
jgi:phytol kinase